MPRATAVQSDEKNRLSDVRLGPEEQTLIRMQVERIVSSSHFSSSKRYPSLLRYVVEESLAGRTENLKERIVGIEVFSREPDYDTNDDHIVRNAASEVRKRLARYYQEVGLGDEIRIDLPPGKYVPIFHRSSAALRLETTSHESDASTLETFYSRPTFLLAVAILSFVAGLGFRYSSGLTFLTARADAHPSEQTLLQVLTSGSSERLNVVLPDPRLLTADRQSVLIGNYRMSHIVTQNITNADILPTIQRIFELIPSQQMSLKHPAQMVYQDFEEDNALMLGGPYLDPWVQLFDNNVNFRTELKADNKKREIRNIEPQSGEKEEYICDEAAGIDYARIAYLPNLANRGKVMLINGPCSACTEAAAHFAMSPESLKTILQLFHVSRATDLPYFELLLEVKISADTPLQSRVVAWRKGSRVTTVATAAQ